MSKKKIRSFLVSKDKRKTTPVQAMVDKELVAKVRAILVQEGFTWRELLEACFQWFLDEEKQK